MAFNCTTPCLLDINQAKKPIFLLCRAQPGRSLKGIYAFGLLLVCRCVSALLNIVHDCDEVYNYWEPLHYLLYGSGMQTWEYRWFEKVLSLYRYRHLLLMLLVVCSTWLPGSPTLAVHFSAA